MSERRGLKPFPVFATDGEAEAFVETADLSEFDLSGFIPAHFVFAEDQGSKDEKSIDVLVARVAAAANIPADLAERAIGLVFAFLKKEAPAEVDDMLREVPGGAEAAARGAADKPKAGGMLGGLMNMMGGDGGLMGLASQLAGIGLGTGEMTTVGKEIFGFAREKAGNERVGKIAAAIPGLGQFI